MIIKEITTREEMKKTNGKNFLTVTTLYKEAFKYIIKILENSDILLVITENLKNDDFKIQFFKITEEE